jgi:ADP-ribosylglycohydrolase
MKNIIIGMAVGDALGVPYEFILKDKMNLKPCTGMVGYGTHGQPVGTWSDDTSMALCLIDSLCNGLNYTDMADKFSKWFNESLWTPHGEVFDFGYSTQASINRWVDGETVATECGGLKESSNGNGSVMRTLALVPYIESYKADIRYKVVSNVSSITHGHWISKLSCYLICEFAIGLRRGHGKYLAYHDAVNSVIDMAKTEASWGDELTMESFKDVFGMLFIGNLTTLSDSDFSGSGYARDTALTSIWCLLTTESYRDATLKAVNYGDDTDTTGCVTGGLAGVLYGVDGIPTEWVNSLARKDDIIELVNKYEAVYDTL